MYQLQQCSSLTLHVKALVLRCFLEDRDDVLQYDLVEVLQVRTRNVLLDELRQALLHDVMMLLDIRHSLFRP